jgi:hypothetical protein
MSLLKHSETDPLYGVIRDAIVQGLCPLFAAIRYMEEEVLPDELSPGVVLMHGMRAAIDQGDEGAACALLLLLDVHKDDLVNEELSSDRIVLIRRHVDEFAVLVRFAAYRGMLGFLTAVMDLFVLCFGFYPPAPVRAALEAEPITEHDAIRALLFPHTGP